MVGDGRLGRFAAKIGGEKITCCLGMNGALSKCKKSLLKSFRTFNRKGSNFQPPFFRGELSVKLQAFFPKDVSSQGSSEDCWRISHHTYPTHISRHTYPTHISHHTYPTHISHHTYPTHIHHTTHIPHISIQNVSHQYVSVQHVSHQYVSMQCDPFKTFASAGFAIRIPPIRIRSTRIPPIRIHAMRIHSMRIHSKGVHQQESQTYPTNTYPTNTYLQHVSHQYGSIQCVSIQKVCISRNGNEYEYHCISFHTIATRREW